MESKFNYWRGKGVSKTKLTKAGEPKHAGNWSASTIHNQSMQYQDYYVKLLTSESGIKVLIVGDHTPLAKVMGEMVETLAINDIYFDSYCQKGEYKGIQNGKAYEMIQTLRKVNHRKSWMVDPQAFIYRFTIFTDGDFTYRFPEY